MQALNSPATWLGISVHAFGFLLWLDVLRSVPLSRAYPLSCLVHVAVPLGAWTFLREAISLSRGLGILLVLMGCLLIASRTALAEERL